MKALLILRLNQGFRNIQSVGIVLAIIALVVSAALWIMGIQFLVSLDWKSFSVVYLLICYSVHFARKDHEWLQIHIDRPYILKTMDYLLISIPFLILYAVVRQWTNILVIPIIAILTGLSPIRTVNRRYLFNQVIESITPYRLFELRGCFRQNSLFWMLPLLTIVLSPLHISLIVVHLVLGLMILFHAFQSIEHRTLIEYKANFINQNIIRTLQFFTLTSLPIYLLTILFHGELFYFIFIHWFALLLTIVFVICTKYALYHPDQIVQSNSIQQAIFLVFLFLPGLFIACLFWNISVYNKAKRNLRYYYD